MSPKKTLKQSVMPIVIVLVNDSPRVLLTSEKNESTFSIPSIELDSISTMHDALKNYFSKIVKLNIEFEDIFRVYSDEDNEHKYQATVFIAEIFAKDNPKVDFNVKLNVDSKFIDAAAFFDLNKILDDFEEDNDDCILSENSAIILSHMREKFFSEDDLESPDDSDLHDDSLDEKEEVKNKDAELDGVVEGIAKDGSKSNKEIELLNNYDENRREKPEEINFDEADGRTIVEPKVINIESADKVVILFENVKNLKITISGSSVVKCIVKKKDSEPKEKSIDEKEDK